MKAGLQVSKNTNSKLILFSWLILNKFSLLTNIYLFKVNNRNARKSCEICSKLTIKTPERRSWRRSGVFIVNFEHILHLFLVFLSSTLNKLMLAGRSLNKSMFKLSVSWNSEATVRRCSVKYMLSKISQISRETTCAGGINQLFHRMPSFDFLWKQESGNTFLRLFCQFGIDFCLVITMF